MILWAMIALVTRRLAATAHGGVGHGRDFAAAVARSVGGAEWSDIVSGIDLLIAEGVADPGRLGIGGASHGGFMAAWAIGQTDRFKAAMMAAGISDWGMLVATGEGGTLDAELSGSCGWEGTGPHPHDRSARRVRGSTMALAAGCGNRRYCESL
jgi:Prolyl oligopeptidase family